METQKATKILNKNSFAHCSQWCIRTKLLNSFLGERMTDEEVDLLVSGLEDQQGQINYEGIV